MSACMPHADMVLSRETMDDRTDAFELRRLSESTAVFPLSQAVPPVIKRATPSDAAFSACLARSKTPAPLRVEECGSGSKGAARER